MIIGIDVDNVVCDTTFATLTQHYADTGEKLTLDDIKTYYIENYVSDDYKDDFHLIFYKKEMWKRVKVIPHCVEVIKRLHDRGDSIYFVTSTEPQNITKKARFLQRTFPFLDIIMILPKPSNPELKVNKNILVSMLIKIIKKF